MMKQKTLIRVLTFVAFLILLTAAGETSAGTAPDSLPPGGTEDGAADDAGERSCLKAVRTRNGGITIDGILDEQDWQGVPSGSDFVQNEPHDGEPATEKTIVRVV